MLRRSIMVTLLLLAVFPAQAQRQVACMEKEHMHTMLAQRYGERTAVRGIASQTMVLELLVNPTTRTWSLLFSSPTNISCLMKGGTAIEFLSTTIGLPSPSFK
jgi:hypothetical protein|tara:strand:- start:132 stop:440 length:309 start_codon:yes stop_codon:yes gene_type:complete